MLTWATSFGLSTVSALVSKANSVGCKIADNVVPFVPPYLTDSNAQKMLIQLRNQAISSAGKAVSTVYSHVHRHFDSNQPPKFIGISRESLLKFRFVPGYPMKHHLSFSFGYADIVTIHYHLGVAQCLKDYVKRNILDDCTFVGSSWGALVATFLASDADLTKLQLFMAQVMQLSDSKLIGPIGSLSGRLQQLLVENVQLEPKKLVISATKLPTLKQELLQDFKNRDQLIQAVLATCYMPLLFEKPVIINGQSFCDGQLSCRQPLLDSLTVTVSPAAETANISPLSAIQVPIEAYSSYRKDILDDLYYRGYQDAKDWFSTSVKSGNLTSLIFKRQPKVE